MTDEKFTFFEDCKEKKHTARSYNNRVTHGGRVRLPSDTLSKKELEKMNGEVKSYNLNNPMKWAEFKALPDDLKQAYVKNIRSTYDVTIGMLMEMFGISKQPMLREFDRIGLNKGKGNRAHPTTEQIAKFYAWKDGRNTSSNLQEEAEPASVPEENNDSVLEMISETFTKISESMKNASTALNNTCDALEESVLKNEVASITPESGTLVFNGSAEQAMETIWMILKDSHVRMTITWDVVGV